jgi:HEAT repeat protein
VAINLSKIRGDLGHRDPQIQTFALISVTRLAPNLVDDESQVRDLFDQLEGLIRSDNPDVVFLARKATNHIRAHFQNQLGGPAARPRAGADPASLDRRELMDEIRASDDPQRLSALVIRLVDRGGVEDLPDLASLLKHENDRVRSNVLEVFARHGDMTHIELVKPLGQDPSNRVRGTAVLAMDRFGSSGARDALEEMLGLSAISMRETAVWVLSQLERPFVAPLLIRALDDPYDGIRLRAVRALAKYPTKESVRALKAAMNDIDINICEAAAESLRALKVLIQGAQQARRQSEAAAAPVEPETPAEAAEPEAQAAQAQEARPAPTGAESLTTYRDLGTSIYQLCRLNAVTHESLDATFYEILRYQDFLRAYLLKKQKGGAPDGSEAAEAIRKLQMRIAKAFVDLGQTAEGLLRSGDIKVPVDAQAEVQGLLARLGG